MTENDKLDFIINKIESLIQDVSVVKEKVSTLENDMCCLKEDNASLKYSMRDMQLTMENRLWPSIQRVAEGHLDLARQLREALKPNQEFEMLSIRLSILETEVQGMKQNMN